MCLSASHPLTLDRGKSFQLNPEFISAAKAKHTGLHKSSFSDKMKHFLVRDIFLDSRLTERLVDSHLKAIGCRDGSCQ